MKKLIPLLTVLLFQASPALAINMEYYTYGGFQPITQAFTRLALIFSDAGYIGLFAVVMVLGIIAGSISWSMQAAMSGRITVGTWAIPIIFGGVLYLALFVPKGNITVYDATLNRFQTIGGIPDAVVLTAGMLNKVERGLVDIIDTSAAPDAAYVRAAGGIGFKVLDSVKGSYPKDIHAQNSMIRYIKDCVTFEIMRPGTSLSLDELRNTSTDFLTELAQAVHPSVYTVYYDSANPSGTTMSCTEAWNNIRPIYANATNYDEAIRRVCGKSQFDPANATELAVCKQLLTSTINHTTGSSVTPEKMIQQRQIAEILYNFYYQDDTETAVLMEAGRKITSSGLGIGLTMNEWVPIIHAIMTAIAIGMIPFLVLFLPTPVMGKAASVMFGFFCFLTIWRITDTVIHNAAMDYAIYVFEDMKQSSLGVYAMASFPNLSTKMLSMFGMIRSAGIMLASFFTMMLIRFGGHALAMMASNLSGIVQGAGSHAGSLFTPEGSTVAMNQQVSAAGLLEGLPQHRFSNMASASAYNLHRSVGGYNASMLARTALQQSSQIPGNTSDASFAQMQASANQTAGTNNGPATVSLGADGKVSMANNTTAGGAYTYSGGEGGGIRTTKATVNGLDPVKVAGMASQQMMTAAGHNLGSDANWGTAWSQIQRDSLTSSTARDFSNRLSNAEASAWNRSFNDKSSFVHSLDQGTQNALQGGVGAGSPALIKADGGYQLQFIGRDGERVSFDVTEDTARAFKRDESRVRSEAITEAMSSSQGLDYATNLAHRIGATEAHSYMTDARDIQRSSESSGADLTTALVRNYARERYGAEIPQTISKAISDLNDMATNQGSQGVQNLHDITTGFVSGKGYGWGSTKQDVQEAINGSRNIVNADHAGHQGRVTPATTRAADQTTGINEGGVNPPMADKPLKEPDGKDTVHDADHLRHVNRFEESGRGRVQTTVTGMMKEGVGKVTKGVVDSPGNAPTAEGYFDYVQPVREVPERPVGPIPAGAKSAIKGE